MSKSGIPTEQEDLLGYFVENMAATRAMLEGLMVQVAQLRSKTKRLKKF